LGNDDAFFIRKRKKVDILTKKNGKKFVGSKK